jgi:hypothetical protein
MDSFIPSTLGCLLDPRLSFIERTADGMGLTIQ